MITLYNKPNTDFVLIARNRIFPYHVTLIAEEVYGTASPCSVIGVEEVNKNGNTIIIEIGNKVEHRNLIVLGVPIHKDSPLSKILARKAKNE